MDHLDKQMTRAQASELKCLAEKAFEPEAYRTTLSQAEAALRIEALKAKLRLQDGPPHTL
jgi:hypothetical protein